MSELKGGYSGQLLRVDLTARKFKKEPLNPAVARTYLGGKGLAAYTFFAEVRRGVVPLSPANKLILWQVPCAVVLSVFPLIDLPYALNLH